MNNRRLLDVKSAADYLSLSRSKIYQLVEKGRLSSLKVDGRRLFDVADLDEFVEELKKDQIISFN